MNRFKSLELESGKITSNKLIEEFLFQSEFAWLLECELDEAEIKIQDQMLFWKSGLFYWGHWKWGVFESGEFRSGDWKGGIFLNGIFKGDWYLGVWKKGTFNGNDLTGKIKTIDLV